MEARRGAVPLVASWNGNQDKLGLDGPAGSSTDFLKGLYSPQNQETESFTNLTLTA